MNDRRDHAFGLLERMKQSALRTAFIVPINGDRLRAVLLACRTLLQYVACICSPPDTPKGHGRGYLLQEEGDWLVIAVVVKYFGIKEPSA